MLGNAYEIIIEGKKFNYQDIYYFQPIEEYDIKRRYNIFKMLYSYIFAPVLPMNDVLDDETVKSNYAVCTKLSMNIWIKDNPEPIQISFLPTKKNIFVRSNDFKKIYTLFLQKKIELTKIFEEIYSSNYQQVLFERASTMNH